MSLGKAISTTSRTLGLVELSNSWIFHISPIVSTKAILKMNVLGTMYICFLASNRRLRFLIRTFPLVEETDEDKWRSRMPLFLECIPHLTNFFQVWPTFENITMNDSLSWDEKTRVGSFDQLHFFVHVCWRVGRVGSIKRIPFFDWLNLSSSPGPIICRFCLVKNLLEASYFKF